MTINVTMPNKKWLTTASIIASTAFSSYSPQITTWIQAHPEVVKYLVGVMALISHFIPSPVGQQGKVAEVVPPKP